MKLSHSVMLLTLIFSSSLAFAAKNKSDSLINPYSSRAGLAYSQLPTTKKGGTFYGHVAVNLKTLNPVLRVDAAEGEMNHYLFARLLERDNETGEFFPMLAEKVQVSKDHKVMVYTLRKEATWSDGSAITSDDVEFTYQKLMDPKIEAAALRAYFGEFRFEKVDLYTFKLIVENPNVNTLSNFNDDFIPMQKKQFADAGDFNKAKGILEPVTSGPYQLKTYSRDQKIELERRKDWWGFKNPQFKNLYNFDTMVFRIIPDLNLAYEKFMKGEIDAFPLSSEQYGARVKGSDQEKFGTSDDSGKAIWATHFRTNAPGPYTYIGWNFKNPMFSSKKTRQALAMLIDYDQIITKVFYGEAIRCLSPSGTNSPNTDPALKKKEFKFDVAKALELLKQDGWEDTDHDNVLDKMIDGKKVNFEFTLRYNSENPLRAKIAQMIKEQFKKAGVSVTVQSMEWNTMITHVTEHDFDAIVLGWANGNLNADLAQVWASKSAENNGSNYISYQNPEVDALIAVTQKELNPQKRFKVVQKIGDLLYDDQPYAFVAEIQGFMLGLNSRIKSKKWVMKYDNVPPLWQYYIEQ